MDSPVINTISLCSGVGMLDEGFAAGLQYLGIDSRTILYAEREAYPCAVLEARMEEGSIHPAPIWCGDFTQLDGKQFRGVVDAIVAGFPCQDLSVAGKRAGLDGDRSGLFFAIADFADACGAQFLFLENVAGIASATATVVDETEGELEERAASRVMGELADRRWDAEWLTLSASDVGASHGRARWFCFAWRMANPSGRELPKPGRGQEGRNGAGQTMHPLAYASRHDGDGQERETGCGRRICETSDQMGCLSIGNEQERPGLARASCELAHSCKPGLQGGEFGNPFDCDREWQEAHGSVAEFCGLFAPGPGDPRWSEIITRHPELSPALAVGIDRGSLETELSRAFRCLAPGINRRHRRKSARAIAASFAKGFSADGAFSPIRVVVNGLAFDMGDCRAARLKCGGNGVVALQAATAFVVLIKRSGILTY